MTDPKPRFRDSAAVILVRGHGTELEVFWITRSERVPYMPGFQAFIGGSVDASDADLPWEKAPEPESERMLRACAIREAFEEARVLVALDDGARVAPDDRDEVYRALHAGESTFGALARRCRWRFRADRLVPAGRWQTPPFASMRFDTSFYLARVEGQEPDVRPGELESGEWIAPREALERWRRGEATFAAPILYTLLALAEGEEALAERIALGPELYRENVRRIELKWGVVLQPMATRPLPPATHTNAYLVGEREMALLDPGSANPEELEKLFALVDSLAKDGRSLKLVLLTHHHPDHADGIAAVCERYRVPVAAHAATAEHVRVDFLLHDEDWIPLAPGAGDWSLRALHTPGHTRGHLCFHHPRTKTLFCGDHIPGGRGTVIIDPPEGDMAAYLESLERLLGEEIETLFPGHGSPQGGAKRRIRNLIEHRRKRERLVLGALRDTPDIPAALVERAYEDTPRELWGYAERSLLAHLLKLEAEGRARRVGDRWGAVSRAKDPA